MCREVLASNKNAVVISNGAKGTDGVLNYQLAKGRNGLEDKDIYIVVTHIGPEEYAQLNVLGQWLGRSDVIEVYYSDQINQAVGRNRGFRDNGCDTKTVVITSLRLWGSLLKRFQSGATRTLLYEENIKPW